MFRLVDRLSAGEAGGDGGHVPRRSPTPRIATGSPGAYFEGLKKEAAFFGAVFGKEDRAKAFERSVQHDMNMEPVMQQTQQQSVCRRRE